MPQNPEPGTKSQPNRIPGLIELCHGIESNIHMVLIHLALHKNLPSASSIVFPHCKHRAEPPMLSCFQAMFYTKFLLRGSPVATADTGALPRVGAPPEGTPTISKGCSNCLAIASSPPSISTAISRQSGFLFSPRSRWKKLFSDWCSIVRL
jgi:hypothetical protein